MSEEPFSDYNEALDWMEMIGCEYNYTRSSDGKRTWKFSLRSVEYINGNDLEQDVDPATAAYPVTLLEAINHFARALQIRT